MPAPTTRPRPDVSPCRSCKRTVRWALTAKNGKPMPLDEDNERGNVIIDGYGRAHVFPNHAAAVAAIDDEALAESLELDQSGMTYISHHAEGQCPQGDEWRNRRRSDPLAPQPPPPVPEPLQGSLL